MRKIVMTALAALTAGILPATAQQQAAPDPDRISPTAKYTQSDAVRARFPNLALEMVAPSLAKAQPQLTTHAEMMAFIDKDISPAASVIEIGKSPQGRAIPAIVLSDQGKVASLAAARKEGRPTVWFIGQQHGNEPAGGEAMLALAHSLAKGRLRPLLAGMNVVIIPRANPDGAETDKRGAANGADLNRDHILLTQAEIRAIHAAMQQLPPDVVFDHHEFSVANRWVEKFGGVQKADAMLLAATHPMVAPDIRAMADELFQKRAETELARHNLTSLVYVTTSYSRKDPVVSTGGAAPGIARNAFGLAGAVSYLVETRGVGIGLEGWQRRVGTHVVIAEAVLNAVRDGGAPLMKRLADARKAVAESNAELAVRTRLKDAQTPMTFVDPVSGEDKIETVALRDSRQLTTLESRPRPVAYVVTADMADTAARLKLNGIASCTLAAAPERDMEAYKIAEPPKNVNREAINPEQTVTVVVEARRMAIPAGALLVRMDQPAAGIIAAALEPDSPGSFVGTGLLAVEGGLAPVYRVKAGSAVPGCQP